ncbi:MAG TPA: glycosyltransferase, partial [Acidimicrobiales bacterium]|nr:glycosyltransferase [Acidimicrobiales bacterium]
TEILAAAANLARRLPVDRALVWSARLRSAGLAPSCPLVHLARCGDDVVLRARAAATVVTAFGDRSVVDAFAVALAEATPAQRTTIVNEAQALCPELLAGLEQPATDPEPVAVAPAGDGAVRVSIVIPCFNKAELTLACLQSMAAHPTSVPHEIIVVDNGSHDATTQLGGLQDERFHVLRNEENIGFGPACNQGAATARGEYVLFLNNDTLVTPGWLEPLVHALDEDRHLGAVQPKLLYPDGRLNDAGGLVFAGGDAWVYGKGAADPDAPPFDCRRAPDYASGACLLVRRRAFDEVGGFDDRYAPAYYEDTDLSFALRAADYEVLYEPASVVVHVEGGTAGTDVHVGLKQYQVRNKERFVEKWADELSWRPAMDPTVVEAWAHRAQGGFGPGEARPADAAARTWADARVAAQEARRILVVDPSMPVYDRASGSLRLFTLLQCLRAAGHEVTFFAAAGGERRYARELGRFGVACYGADPRRFAPGTLYSDTYWPPIDRLLAERRFDTVIVGPWDTAEMMLPGLRRVAPDMLLVVDTNDVHFRRLERAAELSEDPAAAAEARETKRRELAAYGLADRVVCVTDEDADAVRGALPGADVVVVPNAHGRLDPGPGFAERQGCLFVGNFNHLPNGDAVAWWQEQIGEHLGRLLPGCGLTVVGNDPTGAAAALAGPGIEVVGTVASTLPYLHAARVSVAPLRYGAGMKGKVGEALAAGLPLVATSMAAEGMGLVDGEHVLVADTAEDFAAAVARLHQDEELWNHLRAAGRAHVEAHFGLERMRREIEPLLAPARPRSRAERRGTGALARR